MIDDKTPDPLEPLTYELNLQVNQETASPSIEQRVSKNIESYTAEDIPKYGLNKPIKEIVYATITKQEWPIICKTSEETRTTE